LAGRERCCWPRPTALLAALILVLVLLVVLVLLAPLLKIAERLVLVLVLVSPCREWQRGHGGEEA
jgi:hypothetical protein